MRTWGRISIAAVDASSTVITADNTDITADTAGTLTWVEIQTDSNGNNDLVWLVTLIQNLLLNLGESPFYAANGIPAQQSILQQVYPDYYVQLIQQNFAPYFAQLLITKVTSAKTPTYNVNVTTHQGVKINASIPIPT